MTSKILNAPVRTGKLPETLRARLADAIERRGVRAVRAATGLSETTLWRGVAGGGTYPGTQAALELGLAAFDREKLP